MIWICCLNHLKCLVFGKITNVDILNESSGIAPLISFYEPAYGNFGWSKGAVLNICIGQGEILVTPIQVLNFTNLWQLMSQLELPIL